MLSPRYMDAMEQKVLLCALVVVLCLAPLELVT